MRDLGWGGQRGELGVGNKGWGEVGVGKLRKLSELELSLGTGACRTEATGGEEG